MFKKVVLIIFIFVLSLFSFIGLTFGLDIKVDSDKVNKIKKEISDYRGEIEELRQEEEIYEEKIKKARQDATTLENEIYVLETEIAKKQTEIKRKNKEIESQNLIVENIQEKILKQEKILQQHKDQLKELIRVLNVYDQKQPLGILFLESSLSGVLNQLRYLDTLHSEIDNSLTLSQEIKKGLEEHENTLRKELADLIDLKKELKNSQLDLKRQKQTKELVLNQTRGIEWRFQSLLADVIRDRQAIENEIQQLEKKARKEIAAKKEKIAQKLMEEEGRVIFSWPVPNTTITASFHDPDYPFKDWLGEHSAIDIRAKQGTNIRAPAAGYVARAKYGGMGYSYIMLIHNDEFSTIYGHVSQILVEEGEYVKRGDVIAKSGGMPGTPGAGRFSTGPHLHFGVRLNGVPVNPEDYLL